MADSPVGAAEAGSPAEAGSRLGSRAVAAGTPPAAEAGRVERGTRAVARGEGSQTWQQSRYVYTECQCPDKDIESDRKRLGGMAKII